MGWGPGVAVSCGVGDRGGSDAAIAPIRPLAWEPPYATGAWKRQKKKKFIKLVLKFKKKKVHS